MPLRLIVYHEEEISREQRAPPQYMTMQGKARVVVSTQTTRNPQRWESCVKSSRTLYVDRKGSACSLDVGMD